MSQEQFRFSTPYAVCLHNVNTHRHNNTSAIVKETEEQKKQNKGNSVGQTTYKMFNW